MNKKDNFKTIAKLYLAQTASFVWEVVKVVVISLAIILPIRYFLIQPFYVKGSSMEPTYYDYEYLIIDEISYRFNNPERFQVVVIRDPFDRSQYFIKRIIGLPGDTITFKNDKVQVNGVDLDESAYLSDDVATYTMTGQATFQLDDGEFFLLGDNRSASYDSRRFGPVTENEFIGKVWIRAWPFSRAEIIK